MRIVVVGLGKIGLPLAVQYARKGHVVEGVDINPKVVSCVNAGEPPYAGEAHLEEYLREVVDAGLLSATTDGGEAVARADAVVVAVPLIVDPQGHPEFAIIDGVTRSIGSGLQPHTLVSFETTLPVGTTRNRLTPILEQESGLTEGTDFYVVFSPERVFTGRVFDDLRRYPKLVGGVSETSEGLGIDFYASVLDFDPRNDLSRPNGVWGMGSAEAAELAKLAETTYRDVNIALANQFALLAERLGADVYKVIEACNSQPFSHIHQPGISVGGHCIPVYPYLYLAGDASADIVRLARSLNARMPGEAVRRLEYEVGALKGRRVALLGVTYRPSVRETAYSGAKDLVQQLSSKGARVYVHDPMYSPQELEDLGYPALKSRDRDKIEYIILHTAHAEYMTLTQDDFASVRAILDGRSFLEAERWASVTFIPLGRPTATPQEGEAR